MELTVGEYILLLGSTVNKVATYCAEEVRRQGRGPLQVANMIEAWMDAAETKESGNPMTLARIEAWGTLIEPTKNDGFRHTPVFVGNYETGYEMKPDPELIPHLMQNWLANLTGAPDDDYKAFEDIHPFSDGNGRTGKIIFNWLNNSLLDPKWPKNWWGISNP